MNKSNLEILSTLINNKSFSSAFATSIKDLMMVMNYKYSRAKYSNDLKSLLLAGYVEIGIKQGHAESYYITEKGLLLIDSLSKSQIFLNARC